MEISQFVLAQLWLYAFLLGVGLGAVYDALRITRVFLGTSYTKGKTDRLHRIELPYLKPRPRRRTSRLLGAVIFLEDFLFALFGGVAIILLFYQVNSGTVRMPAFLCVAVGFLLYRATLGILVMRVSEIVVFAIETAVRYVFFVVSLPVRYLARLLRSAIRKTLYKHRVRVAKKQRAALTRQVWEDLKRDACGLLPQTDEKRTGTSKREFGSGKQKEKTI